ncbi:PQQ-dependent sugar dehydrogenase [Falsigemmobacter faecalis]|uniref:PQQ-dependent sugar dehydrogenase n=1 Tax=Falsigemmobacter faecalis TaxID=2488730 RepID=A0A3P3DDD3_9RHOB|nr:PQQ-dependent sugar dehydrogenase [Falsigemmobacter faecalis]RRH72329.1 PQQ-dependent sugar dehydrogenase [Falsigemmobacter faecalis]
MPGPASRFYHATVSALALAGLGALPALAAAPELEITEVVSGLDQSWDVAFLPDGTMFITEKCDGLSVRLPSGDITKLIGMEGTEGFASPQEDLICNGQAGMNGVAVDPDFASNRTIYVYSASKKAEPTTNRLMKYKVAEDFSNVSDRTDIIEDIPYKLKDSDHPFGGSGAHNGGRIRFNPVDGYLYVTTGDTHNSEVPQSGTLLGGKVLRIDKDGKAAADNKPPEGFDPRIYTYGHRNVQGIGFRPGTGQPVVAEHGPWHSDEITALVVGGNGGWDPRPNQSGRGECPDNYCGYSPNQHDGMDPVERAKFMSMTDLALYPDAMKPAWNNNGLSQGSGSADFLVGDAWGDWNGRLAVGLMGIAFGGTPLGNRIDVVDLSEDGQSAAEVVTMELPGIDGRFRGLTLGPDNALYAVLEEGQIFRIAPK